MILTQNQIRSSHKNTNAKMLTQDCEFRELQQESLCMEGVLQRRGRQPRQRERERRGERERERETSGEMDRSWRREGQTAAEREEEHQGVRGLRERDRK